MFSAAHSPVILKWVLVVGAVVLLPFLTNGQTTNTPNAQPPASAITDLPLQNWQQAIGPWKWSFPQDHGAHPAFKTEWWYFTGNLQDTLDRKFGYQLGRWDTLWLQRPVSIAHIHSSGYLHDYRNRD